MVDPEPGAWSLFFHPRRWAREISVMTAGMAASDEERSRLEERNMELQLEVNRLQTANNDLAVKTASLENCVGGLTKDLLKTRRELDDRKDTETQIREFDEKISAVEARKREYDEKISRLKEEIRDLRERLGRTRIEFPDSSEEERRDWFEPLPEDL